jgi:hypothetical protein
MRAEMILGRSRLLHGADKDALADGQQVELGKEDAGDVAHAAFRVGILTASPVSDSVLTKDTYQDFRMHVAGVSQ